MSSMAPTASFGIKLLQREVKSHPGQNVWLSPVSVSTVFGMLANGARGTTRDSIGWALALPDPGDIQATNASYARLLEALRDEKALDVQLAVANAIWAHRDTEGFEFNPQFFNVNQETFAARIETADFGAPETLVGINQWAAQSTRGRITNILQELSPEHRMVLANAVYFKGSWTEEFNPAYTEEQDFQTSGGRKKHPLMCRRGMIAYQRCDDFVAVKLPFGKAKRVNFYGFLPDPRTSVDELVDRLDESTFTRLSRSRTCPDCTVYLPRFGLEYDAVLNDSLIGLGMGPAFDPTSADFSAMTNQPVHVGQMNHKTMAAFDEQGGEAAAVSSLGLHLASAVHYTARFDRPFVVALYDEATDALLFVGAVNDPQ